MSELRVYVFILAGLILCVGNQQNRTGRRLNRQNSQLRGELTTPRYTRHIYRCSAALRWCIVKKTNGEHNRESSLFNKFCLKHIDLLVFELTRNRQIDSLVLNILTYFL
jgi:hypothetical protein